MFYSAILTKIYQRTEKRNDTVSKTSEKSTNQGSLYGLLLGLVCQIYISPFGYSGYVISLGTPALNTLLLLKSKLPVGRLTAVMTFSACLLRGLTGVIGHQMPFGKMFIPALLYYGIYSILLVVSLRFLKKQQKSRMMIAMTACDFAANLLQLVFLGHRQ